MPKLLKQLIVVALTIILLVLSPLVGLALHEPLAALYAAAIPFFPDVGDMAAAVICGAIWLGLVALILYFFRELAALLT